MIDGKSLENSTGYLDWWEGFRNKFRAKSGAMSRCIITGELTDPIETATKFSDLSGVGGLPTGTPLICFDKDAFCSYGLSKAANAAVSEEAVTAVNTAIEKLIRKTY